MTIVTNLFSSIIPETIFQSRSSRNSEGNRDSSIPLTSGERR